MNKVLYLCIITLFPVALFGQTTIDYNHKSIAKEIKRTFNIEDFDHSTFLSEDELKTSGLNGSCYTLMNQNNVYGYAYIGRVNSCRAGGCSISNSNTISEGAEYFDYLVVYDTMGVVKKVKVFNYQATHGQEVCSKGWLKQFTGYESNNELRVGKEVDAISGATISVYSITANINSISKIINQHLDVN